MQAPMVGTWSDVWGRRPFLLLSMCFGSLPLAVLLCHLKLGTSLLLYYPASVAGGAVSIISICLAYIADKLTPCYRCSFCEACVLIAVATSCMLHDGC
jgi:MFS family permease